MQKLIPDAAKQKRPKNESHLGNCVPLISPVSFLSFYLHKRDNNKIIDKKEALREQLKLCIF